MTCSQWLPRLFPFTDGELDAESRAGLEAHARDCGACRHRIELELAFREVYVAPLRPDEAPAALRQSTLALLERLAAQRAVRVRWALRQHARLVATAMVCLIVVTGAAISLWGRGDRTSSLRSLAHESVHQHQRLTQHVVPYDVTDVSPAEAERWFSQRLDFRVSLPAPARGDITFRGGRLTHLAGLDAVGLHYDVGGESVSLFVLPGNTPRPRLMDGEPKFHRVTRDGYDVFIWESKGLRYSLVSGIGERSCLVCHAASDLAGRPATSSRSKALP